MNVVFISPNFPLNFYQFCKALKHNGARVLGIGDQSRDSISQDCLNNLDEYYQVGSLENYDEVYRAFAFLSYKYGKIDFVESNNEYWLMQDARLREDFNINSGVKLADVAYIRYKSKMKELYKTAGVNVARYHMVSDLNAGKAFIDEVGYPVVVKPDDGVGASSTRRIDNDGELERFYQEYFSSPMIMEEFIEGELVSYDGICDSNRNVIFETSHVFPRQVMNIVNEKLDCYYWSIVNIPGKLKETGQKVLKAFPSNSRAFHLEFFILKKDKDGLGKKGDIIGLEVNMRPPGGPTLDMMDYAFDIDVYQLWANMVCFNEARIWAQAKYYVVYAARRKDGHYAMNLEDVKNEYGGAIVMQQRNPEVIAGAMGDDVLVARFENQEAIKPFIHKVIGAQLYVHCLSQTLFSLPES